MVVEWPPKVWHGVIDPETGESINPVRMDVERDDPFESIETQMNEREYEEINIEKYLKDE